MGGEGAVTLPLYYHKFAQPYQSEDRLGSLYRIYLLYSYIASENKTPNQINQLKTLIRKLKEFRRIFLYT